MKKVFLIVACMAAMVVSAQENKGGFMAEIGLGTARYGNFSPISVLNDGTETYGFLSGEQISFGHVDAKGTYLGLTYGLNSGYTALLDESFNMHSILLNARRYFPLGHRFNLEMGVEVGLAILHNSFSFAGNDYSFNRYGCVGDFSLGVNYEINPRWSIGVKAHYPSFGTVLNDVKDDIPVGLGANEKVNLSGIQTLFTIGCKF